jgi:MFS family permease
MSLAWPFFPLYIEALGGSATEIGLVYALGGLAGLILYPIGGYIADHRGRVKLVSIATYLYALSFIPFIIAQNWVMLAVGYFTQQLVLFYMPAVNAIMADSLPVHRRGIGFATITAIPQAVGLLSPFIGGYLIDHVFGGGIDGLTVAMRISYTAGIAIGLLVAVIRLKFLQETLKKSDSTVSLHNIPLLLKTSYIHLSKSLKWMSQTLRSIAIIQIVITLFVSIAAPFWVVYAAGEHSIIGLTPYEWGFLMLIVGAIRIALSIPIGYLVDLYGTKRTILLAMLLAPIPIIIFPFCQTFLEVLLTLVLLGLVNALIWPASATLITNAVPRDKRGRLLSILGQGLSIGWGGVWASGFLMFIPVTVGSTLGGHIYASNPQYPWFILAISLILCFILSIQFIHEPEKTEA